MMPPSGQRLTGSPRGCRHSELSGSDALPSLPFPPVALQQMFGSMFHTETLTAL